ncbi:MAG: hypothetical protein CK532_03015 [Flavobacteriales bacterium]|nr:MAG: hypothetical protein CK532_03015 [Flavobacteriales bacterium]
MSNLRLILCYVICIISQCCVSLEGLAQQTFSALMEKGIRLDDDKEFFEAVANFDRAIGMESNNEQAWLSRGVVRIHMKEYGLAVVDFNKAIYLNPELMTAYLYRYIAYRETENYLFAFSDINYYLAHDQLDTIARKYRFEISIVLKEWSVAADDLLWIRKTLGEEVFTAMFIQLATSIQATKSFLEFQPIVTQCYLVNPSNETVLLSMVNNSYQLSEYNTCLKSVNTALVSQPQNLHLLKIRADVLFYLNQLEESEKAFAYLLQLEPSDGNAMADYGHCLLQLKKWGDADTWLTKSIASKNTSPAYAYLGRGIARFNMGKTGIACTDWERSYRLGEKNAQKWLEENCLSTNNKKP